jgi:hypothetical protein
MSIDMINIAQFLSAATDVQPLGLPRTGANNNSIEIIIRIVLAIAGALALLIITLSGFRYITSAGDPQKMSKAKNGIVYALIGLVIAILAQSLVAFVVTKL